jgi:hypothetical protein
LLLILFNFARASSSCPSTTIIHILSESTQFFIRRCIEILESLPKLHEFAPIDCASLFVSSKLKLELSIATLVWTLFIIILLLLVLLFISYSDVSVVLIAANYHVFMSFVPIDSPPVVEVVY